MPPPPRSALLAFFSSWTCWYRCPWRWSGISFYSVRNGARLLGFYITSDICLEVKPHRMALLSYLVNHGIGYCLLCIYYGWVRHSVGHISLNTCKHSTKWSCSSHYLHRAEENTKAAISPEIALPGMKAAGAGPQLPSSFIHLCGDQVFVNVSSTKP